MEVPALNAVVFVLVMFTTSTAVTSQPIEGDVRLQGVDNSALQGRVEVFHDGAWLSVCDESWDSRKGDAVCRQLGFSGGAMSTDRSALFGQGTSSSWLLEVSCNGDEDSLADCTDFTYGRGTCSHANDAGVRCTYPMYEGCFSSTTISPLSGFFTSAASVENTQCLSTCRTRAYEYAGTRNGNQCTCGSGSLTGQQGNSACKIACSGDGTEICGAAVTSSIYRTTSFSSTPDGRYATSPNFPGHYTAGDSFSHTIAIPSGFTYAIVYFSYFKVAAGDVVTLEAAGSTTGTYRGSNEGSVPGDWTTAPGATSFDVTFTVAAATPGDVGFALQFTFGRPCSRITLPSTVAYGSFNANKNSYIYPEQVMVGCSAGYQRDREAFRCQLDGTWSTTPVCSVLPTSPPQPTTDARLLTESPTTSPADVSMISNISPSETLPITPPPVNPCAIPQVKDGSVDAQGRTSVPVGDSITLDCNDNHEPADGNNTATCLANGEFDVDLACAPENGLPVWLISIIVVAAVLAIIVIVLIVLLMLLNREDKSVDRRRQRQRAPPSYSEQDAIARGSPSEDRLVAIPPAVVPAGSAGNSMRSASDDGGTVNQGAQTDADPALGELGDPMVGESDVYHPTRDYPGAGRPPPASLNPQVRAAPTLSPPPVQVPRQRSMEFRHSQTDFSMLPNEELLALRALDNVVSDFERGDQAYYLGPSGPSPYNMDRGSRYGSRQIQFSQRSRLGNFYGLY